MHLLHHVRQRGIFNGCFNPARVIALTQMMEPGCIIDTIGQLTEYNEVLSTEIQLSFWAAKVKAAFGRQFPFGIFPTVTLPFDSGKASEMSREGRGFWAARLTLLRSSIPRERRWNGHSPSVGERS